MDAGRERVPRRYRAAAPDPRPAEVGPNAVKEKCLPVRHPGTPRATRRGGHDAADEAHAEPTEVVMVHPVSFGPSRQLPGAPASVFCTATLRSVTRSFVSVFWKKVLHVFYRELVFS